MTSAYTDWPLRLKKTRGLKNTLMFLCSFCIRSEFLAYPTCCVIYKSVVILSQLTFRGHGKSGVFGVNVFLSSGWSTTFWRPSWACSKVSDPDYWFPALAPVSQGSRVNSPQQKGTLVKTTTDLTWWWNVIDFWCLWEKKTCSEDLSLYFSNV